MNLHLVRMAVDLSALARTAGDRGWTQGPQSVYDEGASLHHLLGETFGAAELQPFRLVVAPRARRGTLYAYSMTEPTALRDLATATATPEVMAALSPERLESKMMPETWVTGRRLGIDVRVRPTVRLSSDIFPAEDRRGSRAHGFRRGAELDAFLAEALRRPGRDAMEEAGRTRETVYRDWLQGRFGTGAELENVVMKGFKRTVSVRKGAAHEGPDVVMHGTLKIADPDIFASLLCRGIGRHRAYGFGMLLLRPPTAKEN